jgi:uncharacterized protein YodC (DUF2158 family)
MSERFETGAIVIMNSGGPWMTVVIASDPWITCHWFDKSGNVQTGHFHKATIRHVLNSDSPWP